MCAPILKNQEVKFQSQNVLQSKALEVGNVILSSNSLSTNSDAVTNLSYKINEARHRMAAVHHSTRFKNNPRGSLFTHNVEYCLQALDDVVVQEVRTEEESKHEKALEKNLDECLVKEACDSFRTRAGE